jgi:hypothetical protein
MVTPLHPVVSSQRRVFTVAPGLITGNIYLHGLKARAASWTRGRAIEIP